MQGMVIQMNDEQLPTRTQLQAFLDGTMAVDFAVLAPDRYGFIVRTVCRFRYQGLKRVEKAVVLRFLERVSGYSRQQLARLVKRGTERGPLLKRYRGSRTSFASIYTRADVLLLAHTDRVGPAGALEPGHRLVAPEPRVRTQQPRPSRTGPLDAGNEFFDEPQRAAGDVR